MVAGVRPGLQAVNGNVDWTWDRRGIDEEKEAALVAAEEERLRLQGLQTHESHEKQWAEYARQQQALRNEDEQHMRDLIAHFDADANGVIDAKELSELLVSHGLPRPSARALDQIFKQARMKERLNAVMLSTEGESPSSGLATFAGVGEALKSYRSYLRHQEDLDDLFSRMDTSGDAVVDVLEMRARLQVLVGDGVTDEDVIHVFKACGHGSLAQLTRDDMSRVETAIAEWLTLFRQRHEVKRAGARSRKSSACAVL